MGIGGVSDVLRSASTLYGQGKVLSDVGTAVLSKSLDVQQQQGDALTIYPCGFTAHSERLLADVGGVPQDA